LAKRLVQHHLGEISDKSKQLKDSITVTGESNENYSEFLEKIPQIFLHAGMAVRLATGPDFEVMIDQISYMTKEMILNLDMSEEMKKYQEQAYFKEAGYEHCDFRKNEHLTMDKIVRSAFTNSQRVELKNAFESDGFVLIERENAENWLGYL